MRPRSSHLVAAVGCLLAVALCAPAGALAAFPGRDGKIAFTDDAPGGGEAIFTINRKGRNRTQLTVPGGFVDTDPSWSADGTQLAFTRILSDTESRVMVVSAAGGTPSNVTPEGSGLVESEPSWSRDGQTIAFRGRTAGTSFLSGEDELYSIGADGSGLTALTSNPGFVVQEPAFSPESDELAYSEASADGSAFGPSDVYILDLATGERHLVSRRRPNADDDDASWRPDARRLVYERERKLGIDDIATIRPNGNRSRLLLRAPDGSAYRDPGYSPSAKKLALWTAQGSRAGISLYNVKKKKLRFLTAATQNESDWQPRP